MTTLDELNTALETASLKHTQKERELQELAITKINAEIAFEKKEEEVSQAYREWIALLERRNKEWDRQKHAECTQDRCLHLNGKGPCVPRSNQDYAAMNAAAYNEVHVYAKGRNR